MNGHICVVARVLVQVRRSAMELPKSFDADWHRPVGDVEKRRGIMMESVDRANRIKCEINFIGGARSEMGSLERMMGSND